MLGSLRFSNKKYTIDDTNIKKPISSEERLFDLDYSEDNNNPKTKTLTSSFNIFNRKQKIHTYISHPITIKPNNTEDIQYNKYDSNNTKKILNIQNELLATIDELSTLESELRYQRYILTYYPKRMIKNNENKKISKIDQHEKYINDAKNKEIEILIKIKLENDNFLKIKEEISKNIKTQAGIYSKRESFFNQR